MQYRWISGSRISNGTNIGNSIKKTIFSFFNFISNFTTSKVINNVDLFEESPLLVLDQRRQVGL